MYYFAVFCHEMCHFFMAFICLKWPKYDGINVKSTKKGFQIKGGVLVKNYKYSSLLYNIINGSEVLEILYLIQQIIAGFFIGFAPSLIPLSALYYFFFLQGVTFESLDYESIVSVITLWQFIISFFIVYFVGLIMSPSLADIKQTLPLFVFLFVIPVPIFIVHFLMCVSMYLLFGAVIMILLYIFTVLFKVLMHKR